ncbi:hypothetical protein VTL71DRAFT_1872 [Oculimacula yallundae]|uniref:Uncharacterized protein n=1 Tax=Oculimacula yallundae TaxID=86028 RepID=A0ABR4CBY2_9HELO
MMHGITTTGQTNRGAYTPRVHTEGYGKFAVSEVGACLHETKYYSSLHGSFLAVLGHFSHFSWSFWNCNWEGDRVFGTIWHGMRAIGLFERHCKGLVSDFCACVFDLFWILDWTGFLLEFCDQGYTHVCIAYFPCIFCRWFGLVC